MQRVETNGTRILQANPESNLAWFCLRSQPKHEHVAARHLQQVERIEVLNPRIRFARRTRLGMIWVTEALFPSYLFACFDWKTSLARVNYAPGVRGVVHFGTRWPTVPSAVIEELRSRIGQEEPHVVTELAPGEAVQIAGGAFDGLEAVITYVMPGKQRVMVLMDFLGRQTMVEVGVDAIIHSGIGR